MPPQSRRVRPARRPTASFSVRSTSSAPADLASATEIARDGRLAPPGKADFVLVLKGARRMLLLQGPRVLRDYTIALGKNPRGPKRNQGDGRTPEGRYLIDGRTVDSAFHRSIHISYPNTADIEFARKAGLAPGAGVMIHGLPDDASWVGDAHRQLDWTNGCIALTDDEVDEVWELVDDGTPIEIRP